MKSTKRSVRRHHYARLKKARRHYWGLEGNDETEEAFLGMLVSTPSRCNCFQCANYRKNFGKTYKEKEFYRITEEELKDYLTI